MSRVVLSEAARVDRKPITADAVERFAIAQARRLRDRFQATLERLAESPLIGRTNEELDPPAHTLRYLEVMKSFIIVCDAGDD